MNNPNTIKKFVAKRFKGFGRNKQQEVSRLIYEIAKREKISFGQVLGGISADIHFADIKRHLLKVRCPAAVFDKNFTPYLPALDIKPSNRVIPRKFSIYPKRIFIEESVKKSSIVSTLKEKFPKAEIKTIPSLPEFSRLHKFTPTPVTTFTVGTESEFRPPKERRNYTEKRPRDLPRRVFTIQDYNKRQDNFFVVKERFDFFKKCPCTQKAVNCHYEILNIGYGCPYECSYCYLQEYTNSAGIILPANIDDFFDVFKKYPHKNRIGTGEFTDSLVLDDITMFSPQLINFFRENPSYILELKTKSVNIKNVLSAAPCNNVVISWSLNPQKIINTDELHTPSLKERLDAACKCVNAGFKVGFHFDPIFHYDNWDKDYKELVHQLFDKIPAQKIAWISLGTFRFSRGLKKIIENRFPYSDILNTELFPGFDGKMRYADKVRMDIYKKMLSWIHSRSKSVFTYLCMERLDIINTNSIILYDEKRKTHI